MGETIGQKGRFSQQRNRVLRKRAAKMIPA
jgi:hypothetical protein